MVLEGIISVLKVPAIPGVGRQVRPRRIGSASKELLCFVLCALTRPTWLRAKVVEELVLVKVEGVEIDERCRDTPVFLEREYGAGEAFDRDQALCHMALKV